MKKVNITGNLTADPELRSTQNGVSVCSFTVAVNDKNGAEFFRVSAWRQLGENCSKYLAKGRKVAVLGDISGRAYTDKSGEARCSLEVNADLVEFLSGKEEKQEAPKQEAADIFAGSGFEDISSDDIPF